MTCSASSVTARAAPPAREGITQRIARLLAKEDARQKATPLSRLQGKKR